MATPQPVAVFGATGAQGSSVAKALLARGVSVVALTRNVESAKAKELAALGAELRAADLDNAATLAPALAGVQSIFLVTDFWSMLFAGKTPEEARDQEIEQVKGVLEAAKAAGTVKFIVFSALEDCEAATGLSVPHFDGKGRGAALVAASGIPYALVNLSFYVENFGGMMPPRRGEDGKLVLAIPMKDKPMGLFSVADTGKVVATILADTTAHCCKSYGLASDFVTLADVAARLSAAVGEPITYYPVPAEDFAKFGFPGAEDLANMFLVYSDHPAVVPRDPANTIALVGGEENLTTLDKWIAANRDSFKF